MEKKPILTIDDIAPDREVVTVFGKPYELLDYEDMGLVKYAKFIKKYQAVGDTAQSAAELDDAGYEGLDADLTAMTETVLMGIPHDVAVKLSIDKKQKVIAAFFTVATAKLKQINAIQQSELNLTTAT